MIEDYLLILDNRQSAYHRKKTLTSIYGQRNLFEYFGKGTHSLLEELDAIGLINGVQTMDYATIARSYFYHNSTPKFEQIDMLLKAQSKLDEFYILEKLGAYCNYPIIERTLKRNLQDAHVSSVIHISNAIAFNNDTLIALYQLIYYLTTQGNNDIFEQTKQYFENQVERLPFEERKFAFFSLSNYCIGQYNKGNIAYHQKSFELNKIGLQHALYLEKGTMTGTSFINIVLNSLATKNFQWAEDFIKSYKDKIIDREKSSAYLLSLGFVYFQQNQYQKCIDILINYQSPKINDLLSARCLLIRSYLFLFFKDHSYLELLESAIKSFEKFLYRSKLSQQKKDRYFNFLSYLKRLFSLKLKEKMHQPQLSSLKVEIVENENVAFKKWLLEFIESLK